VLAEGGMPASAELALPRASIDDDDRLVVEALLRDARGRVLLASAPAVVQRDGERGSTGPLRSVSAVGEAPAPLQGFRCGEVALVVAQEGDELLLALDGAGYRLPRVEAASGARYRRDGATPVEFWNRGDEATLRVGESSLPTCQRVAD
jgi:membrane-bound inhibitor of C-type lysozyme